MIISHKEPVCMPSNINKINDAIDVIEERKTAVDAVTLKRTLLQTLAQLVKLFPKETRTFLERDVVK